MLALANNTETVMLNGKEYPVPKPWAGSRINASEQAEFSELVPLPTFLTQNKSQIYVTKITQQALLKMAAKAAEENIVLLIDSGFRSAQYQAKILEKYLNQNMDYQGLLQVVAPPGYSQHMLGNSIDFVPSELDFSMSKQYAWLKQHAGKYNFIESYRQKNKTGVNWEPWHWQYQRDN
ncbi:MAG: D-alanyl-D-alanine carboxypeptidase family protein [Bermanella sp.]